MTSILIENLGASADRVGTAIENTGNFRNGSFQFYFSGLNQEDGKAQVQVSNDSENNANTVWTTLSELEVSVASTDQSCVISIPSLCFKWYRPRWENGTNSAGTVKATINMI